MTVHMMDKSFEIAVPDPTRGPHLRLMAISAMTPTLLHELSQPLGAAMNNLEVAVRELARRDRTDAAAEAVERARSAVARTADILRRMRTFVLEGDVRAHPVNIELVVERVRSGLTTEQASLLEVDVDLGPDADCVCADDLLIELVLRNLLVNAIEAVPEGSKAKVAITSCRIREEIILTLTDAGPGFSPDVHAKLFDPMFTTKESGSGLGLPLSRTIVAAHGGQLWPASPGADGAIFYMTLPAPSADAEEPDAAETH